MAAETGSQSLGIASELIVVMPIKKGFVETRTTVSYATRIRLILKTLHAVRKVSVEANSIGAIAGPLERLQIIDVVRWSVLENETKLMMAVSFKGAWEPYIRKIQQQAGVILDAVLCNCEGYADRYRSELGYHAFAEWVRKNQIRCEQYYSATPDITVDDLQYLKELATRQRNDGHKPDFDLDSIRQIVKTPDVLAQDIADANVGEYQQQWLRILSTFHLLDKYFPDPDAIFLRKLTRAVLGSPQPKYALKDELKIPYALQLEWINRPEKALSLQPSPQSPSAQQLPEQATDIQGGILQPYDMKTAQGSVPPTHGVVLLLRFRNARAGRNFLQSISGSITREGAKITPDGDKFSRVTNIALTFEGLRRLGLPAQELERLPREFRDGMEARAGVLGDVRDNHPRQWKLPRRLVDSDASVSVPAQTVALSTVDCVVQLQTIHDADYQQHLEWSKSHPLCGDVETLMKNAAAANGGSEAVELLAVQVLRRAIRLGTNDDATNYGGHFGFVEGFSQPSHAGDSAALEADKVPLGELLLGYPNVHGDKPDKSPLFLNSTFMVLRKLRQDVGAFERFLADNSSAALSGELLKAKMCGRFSNGDPLLPAVGKNDFDFNNDESGERCPLNSHIRRSNPRKPGTPRIIRRGFSYGSRYQDRKPETDTDRGLFFMAFNASIADQFEVIQQWLSGGNITGLSSAESDPLMGIAEHGKPRMFRFIHNGAVQRADMNVPGPQTQFVTLEWGMYLFVPSLRALDYLAALPAPDQAPVVTPQLQEKARESIERLKLLELLQAAGRAPQDGESAVSVWKKLLEDVSTREGGLTEALWKEIRENHKGVLRTNYGVLVGDEARVMQIFRDRGKRFSVRKYWQRMRNSIGEGFLGMDPSPTPLGKGAGDDAHDADKEYCKHVTARRYEKESTVANVEIAKISRAVAFSVARHAAGEIAAAMRNVQRNSGKFLLQIDPLCEITLAKLSTYWFGIPGKSAIREGIRMPDGHRYCPTDFVSVGAYVFNPNPTEFVARNGQLLGQALKADIEKYLDNDAGISAPPLLQALQAQIADKSQLARTLGGLIQGFVTPTYGSFLSLMSTLIDKKELWHLQLDWRNSDKTFATAERVLRDAMIDAMRAQPVPGLLHRTCVSEHKINGTTVHAGEKVVLGLVSATRQPASGSRTELLFGGDYEAPDNKKTAHPCPGKEMALGVMLGMLSVILEQGDLRNEAPLVLAVN